VSRGGWIVRHVTDNLITPRSWRVGGGA